MVGRQHHLRHAHQQAVAPVLQRLAEWMVLADRVWHQVQHYQLPAAQLMRQRAGRPTLPARVSHHPPYRWHPVVLREGKYLVGSATPLAGAGHHSAHPCHPVGLVREGEFVVAWTTLQTGGCRQPPHLCH